MKVVCKNIICKGRAFSIDQQDISKMDRVICPHCGHQGAMPKGETVTGDEVIYQVGRWKDQVLYKDVFKHINLKKLPKTMDKQLQPGPRTKRKQRPPQPPRAPPTRDTQARRSVHDQQKQRRQTRIKPRRRR